MLIKMTIPDLAAHLMRKLGHEHSVMPVDFYQEYDPDRNWKKGGFRAVYSNFVDADMILINDHKGGALTGFDCSENKSVKALTEHLTAYFRKTHMADTVWVETSEKVVITVKDNKIQEIYATTDNLIIQVVDIEDEREEQADILREFSAGRLHNLY